MRARLLPMLYFTIRRFWRVDRPALVTGCFLIATAIGSSIATLLAHQSARHVEVALAAMVQAPAAFRGAGSDRPPSPVLLGFQGHLLPEALNDAAVALALPVNEMVFRLDDNPSRPYLRYTATVKVLGGYPVIRSFLATMHTTLPGISLDAISCARTDIRSVPLGCEMTLSAFYSRGPHA